MRKYLLNDKTYQVNLIQKKFESKSPRSLIALYKSIIGLCCSLKIFTHTKKLEILFIFLLIAAQSTVYSHNFESSSIPGTIRTTDGKSILTLSKKYFKDGKQSLCWEWTQSEAILVFSDPKIADIVHNFKKRSGIKLWIYNESPQKQPLTFCFKDDAGNTQYTFDFHLNYYGWRAAWIAYSDMWTPDGGKTTRQNISSLEIISPKNITSGMLWIDRMEYSHSVDRQTTPDAQIPENNRHLDREIWHWGLLHKWEQMKHDLIVPKNLTTKESADVTKIYNSVKKFLKKKTLSANEQKQLIQLEKKFAISDDGKRGAPLMQKNNTRKGDVNFKQLNDLIDLSARGWYMDKNPTAQTVFIKTIRYMLNQGFAYESGMGTNHHYGYDIRDMFGAIWWMEDILRDNNLWEETRKAITFWSGLQESRQPYVLTRDEITDSWNTLILPRLACALMADTEQERFRNIKALSRWVNGSLTFTSGTIGGIKTDGTVFHHGGHYPAYGIPGMAYIGRYVSFVNGTIFGLDEQARSVFKFALLSASRQCNLYNWGIGASGRHPFNGFINRQGVQAFAHLAQAFNPIDKELAAEYLRLAEGLKDYSEDKKLKKLFQNEGIVKADYPQGFYTYNYASQGIYRYDNKMISIKGFTRNIWGAEIYAKDNRFGRYQSYGSIQIIGTPDKNGIINERASRYVEKGWDWNLNPGTTVIYLPFNNLNSPIKGSDMLRQPETFAGSSRLGQGKYGMFAMKLGERDRQNFTPSFHAYKSAYCLGNRIICIGSNISNENHSYETRTTLFQQHLLSKSEPIEYNETIINTFPYYDKTDKSADKPLIIKDLSGYYYYIPPKQSFVVERKTQQSFENKEMKPTQGDFVSAYLNHGVAPSGDRYEYLILLDPTQEQIDSLKNNNPGYKTIRNDSIAHIIKDEKSGIMGYAVFETYMTNNDEYLLQSDKEVMIMLKDSDSRIEMSVCSPDLNLGSWTYTTSAESQPIIKHLLLKGKYQATKNNDKISLAYKGENTQLSVTCQHGIPVEFTLYKENKRFSFDPDTIYICSGTYATLIGGIAQWYKWILPNGTIQEGANINSLKTRDTGMYILEMQQDIGTSNTIIDTCWVFATNFSDGSPKSIAQSLRKPFKVNKPQTFYPTISQDALNRMAEIKWTFEDGTPSESNSQNPTVTFNTTGVKRGTLYMKYKTTYPDSTCVECDSLMEFRIPVFPPNVSWFVSGPSTPNKAGIDYNKKSDIDLMTEGRSWENPFNLQDALCQASWGDTIFVQKGTYTPAKNNAFIIDCDSITIIGGFRGWEKYVDKFIPDPLQTVIQGNGTNAIVFDNNAALLHSGTCLSSSTTLKGFTIQDGVAVHGGGIFFKDNASGTIAQCIVKNNTAKENGGGIYTTKHRCGTEDPILYNVEISGNHAKRGGGLYNAQSSPTLTNVTIGGNSASLSGSGVYNENSDSAKYRNTIIYGNLTNNIPMTDEFTNDGGMPRIHHSIIKGCNGSGKNWNAALGMDGGKNADRNPIYLRKGYTDEGKMQEGNYRIVQQSPAYNTGYNAYVYKIKTDLAGNDRIYDYIVDMGAYEYHLYSVPKKMHTITIGKYPHVKTIPTFGTRYVMAYNNYTIIFKPEAGYTLKDMKITTGSAYQDNQNGMKKIYNADGSVTVIFTQVNESLNISLSGVNHVSNPYIANSYNIRSESGQLFIKTDKVSILNICSMTGQLIFQSRISAGETIIPLPRGVYIVTCNNEIKQKIVIR